QLYKFMEDRGTPINKKPVLGYRNLDLFKLYRLVHKLGGFHDVIRTSYPSPQVEETELTRNKPELEPLKAEQQKAEREGGDDDDDDDEEGDDHHNEQEAELCFIDFRDESCSQEGDGGDVDLGEEGEEFDCYPPGMKVQVRYGRGRILKTYQATVKEADVEGGEVLYLVHYCGWNVRYDEWVKADKIVRPANKNVQKIKHRKKIKVGEILIQKKCNSILHIQLKSEVYIHLGWNDEGGAPPPTDPNQSEETDRARERPSSCPKPKPSPSKKYNGMKDKTDKGGGSGSVARPVGFWDIPEKRAKMAAIADERERQVGGGRTKGQKDVWSSIQAQWPKKTLKELFSDSDTEAANSPPPPGPAQSFSSGLEERESKGEQSGDGDEAGGGPEREDPETSEENQEKKERMSEQEEFPSSGSNSVLNTPPTTPESPSMEGISSGAIVQSSGTGSNWTQPSSPPPSIGTSALSGTGSNWTQPSSPPPSTETSALSGTGSNWTQPSSPPPSSGAPALGKTPSSDLTPGLLSFQCCSSPPLADLEKMCSLERISFLQEKLQDIRNHYLSLKSEVASIDRRRKRIKKKERESESS
uniref:ARID domain-containing protein n=1 Tax=Hucho hucho TaxID=62062 RepID=A0A4W5MM63_9TELE